MTRRLWIGRAKVEKVEKVGKVGEEKELQQSWGSGVCWELCLQLATDQQFEGRHVVCRRGGTKTCTAPSDIWMFFCVLATAMRGSGAVLNTPTNQRPFLFRSSLRYKVQDRKKGFWGTGTTWLAPHFQSVIGPLIQWDDLVWKKRRYYSPVWYVPFGVFLLFSPSDSLNWLQCARTSAYSLTLSHSLTIDMTDSRANEEQTHAVARCLYTLCDVGQANKHCAWREETGPRKEQKGENQVNKQIGGTERN